MIQKEYILHNYVVTGVQYNVENLEEIKEFVYTVFPACKFKEKNGVVKMSTDDGMMKLNNKNFIVSDILGNFYILSEETFNSRFTLKQKDLN